MSTAEQQINTQPAPPPTNRGGRAPQITSPEQAAIRRELCQTYDLTENQVSFVDPYINDPILDFEALFAMANALTDHRAIDVSPADVDRDRGYVTADCIIILADGRSRKIFGSAFIGETLHDDSTISDLQQALEVARSRALRGGLRAVGFNAMKAHRAAKADAQAYVTAARNGSVPPAVAGGSDSSPAPGPRPLTQAASAQVAGGSVLSVPPAVAGGSVTDNVTIERNASAAGATCTTCNLPWADCRCNVQPPSSSLSLKDRIREALDEADPMPPAVNAYAEAHMHGKHIGLIVEDPSRTESENKEQWRWMMETMFGVSSMSEMTDVQQNQWLAMMRNLRRQYDTGKTRDRSGH